MEPAIVGALSAVLGSLVGGSATFATAWVTQNASNRREMILTEIRKRETLYGEFITECSKLALDAFDHSIENPSKLLEVYALQNRVRLTSSKAVVAAADDAVRNVLKQYFEVSLTVDDFKRIATLPESDPAFHKDPLRGFSEACRIELLALRKTG